MSKEPLSHPSKRLLTVLGLHISLGLFATYLYLPSFPAIGKAFAASQGSVQFTLTIFFFGFSTGSIILGPLCDRMGRVIIAKGGLILFIIASFLCAQSSTIVELLATRFIQGVAASTGLLVANAIGRDLYTESQLTRFFSSLMIIASISPIIASPLGGIIEEYLGWEKNFYLLMFFGIFVALIVWIWLPRTDGHRKIFFESSFSIKNYSALFKKSDYGIYCFIMGVQLAAIFCYITLSPFLFVHLFGWTAHEYGFVGAGTALGNIVGLFFARYLAPRLYFKQGVFIGNLFCFLLSILFVMLFFSFPLNANLLVIYAVFFFMFSALAVMNASAGAMNLFPQQACTSSAMLDAIQIGSGTFGSAMAIFLPVSPLILGIVMGVLILLSLVSGLYLKELRL
jgi:DHA1 family bicyclomycin/chloramphenicol resistance-like MFS transporter